MAKNHPHGLEGRISHLEHRKKKVPNQASVSSLTLSRLRSRTSLAIIIIALGAAAIGYKKCLPSPPTQETSVTAPEQENALTFIVDGITIISRSVPENVFRQKYEKALRIIGRLYWEPRELSVEYGNIANDSLARRYDVPGSRVDISYTSDDYRTIVAQEDALAHELVHFLLGPTAGKRLPTALQEIIASAAEKKPEQFHDSDLDAEWVQIPSLDSFSNASPLMTPRYAAFRAVAKQCGTRMPEIVATALQKRDFTFEKLSAFFQEFGIQHHILHLGQTGEQHAFVPFMQGGQRGYLYVRYKREQGNSTEFPWDGPISVRFIDENGVPHMAGQFHMQGMIHLTNLPAHFHEVLIQHPDGNFTAAGDR